MSIHDKLIELDEQGLEDVSNIVSDVRTIDSNLKIVIKEVAGVNADFDEYTIKELKEFFDRLENELEDIRGDIY